MAHRRFRRAIQLRNDGDISRHDASTVTCRALRTKSCSCVGDMSTTCRQHVDDMSATCPCLVSFSSPPKTFLKKTFPAKFAISPLFRHFCRVRRISPFSPIGGEVPILPFEPLFPASSWPLAPGQEFSPSSVLASASTLTG